MTSETRDRGRAARAGTRTARTAATAGLVAGVLVALAGCGAPPAPTTSTPVPAHPVPAAPLTGADVVAYLDGMLPAALDRADIAGAAVTVVHDGQVLASRGYGYADSGSDGAATRPVDPDRTLFRVGSVSKVFTATAVLQLVEQGVLDLDVDVDRYLDFPLPRRFDEPVTLRTLLTHTAGFEERAAHLMSYDEPVTALRDVVAVDPPEQVFAPGTVPSYSNYGYALAGYVVERVTGTPFTEHVDRAVLARAGMASSSFAQPLPLDLAGRLSRGYTTASAAPVPFEVVAPAPAGALTASAADMGRFMLGQLGGPGDPLLGPATLALAREPALSPPPPASAGGPQMTLGMFDESRNGHHILGHGGDTQHFHAHLQLYPDDATGVFIALNSTGAAAADTLEVREALLTGFADRYFPGDAPAAGPVTGPATGHAALAAGSYESARASSTTFLSAVGLIGQTVVTARPDGTVLVDPGPAAVRPAVYEEIRPWVWREVGGQRVITMRPDGDAVGAIGFESAFTLLRTAPGRDARVALPVLVSSVAVLVLVLLAWPVGAVVRRSLFAAPAVTTARRSRRLARVAALCAVVALVGWAVAVMAALDVVGVPEPALRVLQVLQWAAVVGVVPAAVAVVLLARRRAGWILVTGSALRLAALTGTAWFAAVSGLLSTSVSY